MTVQIMGFPKMCLNMVVAVPIWPLEGVKVKLNFFSSTIIIYTRN